MDDVERDRKIIELRMQGRTMADISRTLACPYPVVRNVVNHQYKTREEEQQERRDNVLILRKKGYGPTRIARQLGLSRLYVTRVISDVKRKEETNGQSSS